MAKAMVLILLFCILMVSPSAANTIGVNWGVLSTHPIHPSFVVQMLKDNGIQKVKLFDADSWTVNTLAGTGIEVMLGIPNYQLQRLANKYSHAKDWVQQNVTKHLYEGGVDIKYVAVGNEPFLKSYNGSFLKSTFPALQNIQKALDEAGHGDQIKATVPLNADVYESASNKPSDGKFRNDIKDLMTDMVKYLKSINSVLVVNIYPFLCLYQNSYFPKEFAFFDGGANPVQDKNISYTNVFDANYDTLVWTLKKAGVPDLKIVVGEVGWPTDGDKNANFQSAQKFYDGLFKKLASNKGTPLRPGGLDVYLFGLIDENAKSIQPGNFERHWGIFTYDGKPKFPMDLSGKGNGKLLVPVKGVQYLESQWCVLKEDMKDNSLVGQNMDYACSLGDCTSLTKGSSCSQLDERHRTSYAFNMYFQINDQSVEACDFQGLATITKTNATVGNCLFPIQIVSAGHSLNLASAATSFVVTLLILFSLL
ncbi:Glycoside hydrolase family 17 [Dillenia turbinata]|uniref:glucan endo-1,3-beta-D-glucosidase n=1 Tax=Dillenia turbinata TaxID=194707 RepID=A0AAN8UYC3_9MAGN